MISYAVTRFASSNNMRNKVPSTRCRLETTSAIQTDDPLQGQVINQIWIPIRPQTIEQILNQIAVALLGLEQNERIFR